jgi:hypothetical protein
MRVNDTLQRMEGYHPHDNVPVGPADVMRKTLAGMKASATLKNEEANLLVREGRGRLGGRRGRPFVGLGR